MTGECRFCGQTMMVETSDKEYADQIATEECKCQEGREYRNIEGMKADARVNAEELFKIEDPADEEEERKNLYLLDMMDVIINNLAAGTIKRCSFKLNERTTASMSISAGGIEIKKNYKEEYALKAVKY